MLGVCLGHQVIVEMFGGEVVRASRLMHGKSDMVTHDGSPLYDGMPSPFEAGRYHSLAALEVPGVLEVTARTADGEVMGVRHRERAVHGRAVPPGVGADARGPAAGRELPGDAGRRMITEAIKTLVDGHDLTSEAAHAAMMQVMEGEAVPPRSPRSPWRCG